MKDVGGAGFAGSSPPLLGRERAAVDVDVGPERRRPRYHETCLALESVQESSAAVLEPRCVWLRVLVDHDLKEGCRLPVRVQKQQAQLAACFPPSNEHKLMGLGFRALKLHGPHPGPDACLRAASVVVGNDAAY